MKLRELLPCLKDEPLKILHRQEDQYGEYRYYETFDAPVFIPEEDLDRNVSGISADNIYYKTEPDGRYKCVPVIELKYKKYNRNNEGTEIFYVIQCNELSHTEDFYLTETNGMIDDINNCKHFNSILDMRQFCEKFNYDLNSPAGVDPEQCPFGDWDIRFIEVHKSENSETKIVIIEYSDIYGNNKEDN